MPITIDGTGTITGATTLASTVASPTFTTPALGTPASGILTSCTGYAAANLPAGSVLQVVRAETAANTSGSAQIPLDNTIPQITEGFEVLTCSITPISASSKLYIVSTMYAGEASNITNSLVAALFRDSTANAFAVSMGFMDINNLETGTPIYTSAYINSTSTAATTIQARLGQVGGGGAIILNIAMGTSRTYPVYGGVYFSSITIMEIAQ